MRPPFSEFFTTYRERRNEEIRRVSKGQHDEEDVDVEKEKEEEIEEEDDDDDEEDGDAFPMVRSLRFSSRNVRRTVS